jgi:hypothetical protein
MRGSRHLGGSGSDQSDAATSNDGSNRTNDGHDGSDNWCDRAIGDTNRIDSDAE